MLDARLLSGFAIEDVSTTGATIRTLRAGSGPPLLRLARLSPHVIWWKDGSLRVGIILRKSNRRKSSRNTCASFATKEEMLALADYATSPLYSVNIWPPLS